MKAYAKPPPLVETVLAAVMTLMGRGADWATAKKALGEGNFLGQVRRVAIATVPIRFGSCLILFWLKYGTLRGETIAISRLDAPTYDR